MFTGIVTAVGRISEIRPLDEGVRIVVEATGLDLSGVAVGDSIAVDGVCLTVVEHDRTTFLADVSRATLDTVAGFAESSPANLEAALRLSDRLGGHLVTGHVDGWGTVTAREQRGESLYLAIRAPGDLPRYIARKGSITVNGVSLTVNGVDGPTFHVNVIPHTLAVTTLSRLAVGDRVNLEVDLLARYAERAREWGQGGAEGSDKIPL